MREVAGTTESRMGEYSCESQVILGEVDKPQAGLARTRRGEHTSYGHGAKLKARQPSLQTI
jgi:hypothetical protein